MASSESVLRGCTIYAKPKKNLVTTAWSSSAQHFKLLFQISNVAHGGRKPYFSEIFLQRHDNGNVKVLFDNWLAEDGGRFYKKRNRGILIEVSCKTEIVPPTDDFIWLSLFQVKQLLLRMHG